MMVYLIRHGIAERLDEAHGPGDDAERTLTDEGVTKFRGAARAYARLISRVDRVASSPLRRARETAELARDAFRHEDPTQIWEELHFGAAPSLAHARLQDELLGGDCKSIVLVGHEPQLGSLLGLLVTGSDRAAIALSKGMCVGVEIETAHNCLGRLRFSLSQKAARKLAQP